jgi:hypothetical protein
MTPRQVAELGVSRLGLPVPMAKLVIIQAIAAALDDEATAEIYADALIEWIRTRELESQCLEALCPLLIAEPKPDLVARIRQAITRPSLASALLMSIATNTPVEVSSWAGCHSSLAPRNLDLTKEEKALCAGSFIPPLFTHKLEKLQEHSSLPFLRQWAFEYRKLSDHMGIRSDGHLDYFLESERNNTGQFVAMHGHLARSAYLRTLACAIQRWKMPDDDAFHYASIAFPAEPIFLRLVPQSVPAWASFVHTRTAADASDAHLLARTVVQHIEQAEQAKIMHCSLAVVDEPRYHVELEVFAVVRTGENIDADGVIGFYHHLLGEVTPFRYGLRSFVSRNIGSEEARMVGFGPLVVPLIGPNVGYLQTESLARVPYMPLSTRSVPKLELVPQKERAALRSGGREVGAWNWWRWNWEPSHPRGWPTPTACCAHLRPAVAQQMADDLGGYLEYVWMLTTWQRDSDYGDWSSTEQAGILEC